VRRAARVSAQRLGQVATDLRRSGTRDFLILNLPDIGAVPRYGDDPDGGRSATRATEAFNRELDVQIAALRDDGAQARKVNAYGLFNDLLEHPRRYGVRNTTTPCLDGDDPCSRRQGLRRAFFDEIHPNRVIHRRIAEAAMARIEPSVAVGAAAPVAAAVPLPPAAALLLGGVLALAATSAGTAARARRRAR
jgi:phospholipase/lecithinase/hemolysin